MMRNNLETLQKEMTLLLGAISMRINYWSYGNIRPTKVLLVEGSTDKKFIDQYVKSEVLSQIGICTFGRPHGKSSDQNVKKTIIRIVRGATEFKALLHIPPRMQDVEITGMVDKDFDSEMCYSQDKNIFVTDTHDLETLMLSTDKSVLKRFDDCPLQDIDIQRSIFRAYQIGVVLPVLHEYKIDTHSISGGDSCADYNSFFDGQDRVSLSQLLEYLLRDKRAARSCLLSAAKHKAIRSKFDKEHFWNSDLPTFYRDVPSDLWKKINGHDVLALIMFFSAAAALKFNSKSKLNRKFEMAIIEKYKKENFKNTDIYRKMQGRAIV